MIKIGFNFLMFPYIHKKNNKIMVSFVHKIINILLKIIRGILYIYIYIYIYSCTHMMPIFFSAVVAMLVLLHDCTT